MRGFLFFLIPSSYLLSSLTIHVNRFISPECCNNSLPFPLFCIQKLQPWSHNNKSQLCSLNSKLQPCSHNHSCNSKLQQCSRNCSCSSKLQLCFRSRSCNSKLQPRSYNSKLQPRSCNNIQQSPYFHLTLRN